MAAIKVYGVLFSMPTTRALVALAEKGLDFEFVPVDMRSGQHKQEPFLSLNPFGQIPAFQDGDHFTLFESRAIAKYVAEAYGKQGTPLVLEDAKAMGSVYVWMEVEAQKYDPIASKLAFELCIKPLLGMETDNGIVEEQQVVLGKVLDVYEARLAQSKYLGGDVFTLADLYHLPTLSNLMGTKVKDVLEARPHVYAWAMDILARPAWKKVDDMKNHQQ